MKKFKRWLIAIGLLLVVGMIAGQVYLKHAAHAPASTAAKVEKQATHKAGVLYFGKPTAKLTVVVYPGALVDPGAYSIWAQTVAQAGYRVAIVSFPDDLAVLKPNAAAAVLKSNQPYVIGGHSLGGVMASRYAAKHSRNLKGVFFLASYPDAKGALRDVPVLSLTASHDQVLKRDAWRKAKANLPDDTQYHELSGGNHAGFGDYGKQAGDGVATISNATQQRWVAEQLISWLASLQ